MLTNDNKNQVLRMLTPNKNSTIASSGAEGYLNVKTIVDYDDYFQDIQFNSLTERIEVKGGLLDNYYLEIAKQYIAQEYKIWVPNFLETAIINKAKENSYNPMEDIFKDCLEHYNTGETGNIKKLFVKYLGCEDNETTETIARILFTGIVDRALYPGCKFDYCIVLYGGQGIGKSTFCRLIAMEDKYFTSSLDSIRDTKKVGENTRGKLVVELEELKAFQGESDNVIKSFITTQVDNYREAYGRHSIDHKKSYVLIGTTNKQTFLRDITGNRRYLPLHCNQTEKHILSYPEAEVLEDIKRAYAEAYSYMEKHPDYRQEIYCLEEKDILIQLELAKVTMKDERVDIVRSLLENEVLTNVTDIQIRYTKYFNDQGIYNKELRPLEVEDIMRQIPEWKQSEPKCVRKRINGVQSSPWWYNDYLATEDLKRQARNKTTL